jgi:hypothetical protein
MKDLGIKAIIAKLEKNNINVYEYKESKKPCGYELNTYTNGGVNQIIFIDFRDTDKSPTSGKHFLELFNERINDIDIDEEIQLNRQDKNYCANFSLEESVQDFKEWKESLLNIFNEKTAQQRQFEQVVDKLRTQLAEMEETLKLIPRKGSNTATCQRTNISNYLGGIDSCINGIELEDFTPNEYSGDFKLSYS